MPPRNTTIHNLIYGRQGAYDEPWFSSQEQDFRRQHELRVQAELAHQRHDGTEARNASISLSDHITPTNQRSNKLAKDMMRACNSVFAVMGVVELKSRGPPDMPSFETKELETQRALQEGDEQPRGIEWWKYVKSILMELFMAWPMGTAVRLNAWPIRSRMPLLQQALFDYEAMAPADFFLRGLSGRFILLVLNDGVLRARLRYLLERMVLASVSSSQGRSFWLACLPYIEPALELTSALLKIPIRAHVLAQLLGIVPVSIQTMLPQIWNLDFWSGQTLESQAFRALMQLCAVQGGLAMGLMMGISRYLTPYMARQLIEIFNRLDKAITSTLKKISDRIRSLFKLRSLSIGKPPETSPSNLVSGESDLGICTIKSVLIAIPLQTYFFGKAVGRQPILGAGIPGRLGLSSFRELGSWFVQAELVTLVDWILDNASIWSA